MRLILWKSILLPRLQFRDKRVRYLWSNPPSTPAGLQGNPEAWGLPLPLCAPISCPYLSCNPGSALYSLGYSLDWIPGVLVWPRTTSSACLPGGLLLTRTTRTSRSVYLPGGLVQTRTSRSIFLPGSPLPHKTTGGLLPLGTTRCTCSLGCLLPPLITRLANTWDTRWLKASTWTQSTKARVVCYHQNPNFTLQQELDILTHLKSKTKTLNLILWRYNLLKRK